MRRRKADFERRVNGNLTLAFTRNELSSYVGLELLRRFLTRISFSRRLRARLDRHRLGGDFRPASIIRLLLAMLLVGAQRLRHVTYLADDPLVARFCGLSLLPSDRTLSRWLGGCTRSVRRSLQTFQTELLAGCIESLGLCRLTVDVDGTIVSTGQKAERAFRGFNPHHRKVPSYYPITAHLAQTSHILRVQNRSGNVHDGKASMGFLRDLFADLGRIAPGAKTEIRLDGAFFRQEQLRWLSSRAEYAVKVPFYWWLDLKSIIQRRRRWKRITQGLDGFEVQLPVETWGLTLRVAIYRKRVMHMSPKNFQLDLFDPADGHWEYSAIATNKTVGLKALWNFMAGRGAHEKTLSELKSGYAFDAVPCQHYAGNSTWQILSAMAHNLMVSFQIETGADRRRQTAKRSPLFRLRRITTLRFEWICRAGLLQRPAGRQVLKLAHNLPARKQLERLVLKLQAA